MQTAYQNTKNQCFWRPESLDFPWEACPQPPTLLCTKKQFYPTKMQNLRAIILTNQLKTTWPSSNGTPSNAVNILYVCYFLGLPKFLLRLLVFFFYNVSLYRTMSVLCLWQFKTCSSHFSFFLHPFSLSLFFLSFFFFLGGGGGLGAGKASKINLG